MDACENTVPGRVDSPGREFLFAGGEGGGARCVIVPTLSFRDIDKRLSAQLAGAEGS